MFSELFKKCPLVFCVTLKNLSPDLIRFSIIFAVCVLSWWRCFVLFFAFGVFEELLFKVDKFAGVCDGD